MEDLEIRITNRLKNLDSGLINYLISIRDENDIYNIIKKNKYINIHFENIEYITYLVEGLLYFDNKKILEDVLKNILVD